VIRIPALCHTLALAPDEKSVVCEELEWDSEVWVATRGSALVSSRVKALADTKAKQ
jgi:hypothetical protein